MKISKIERCRRIKMNKKKSTGLLLSILGVISLVLITAGVTYAFFSYAKEGVTENTISTGTITFYYDELAAEGNGIKITDALPMSDEDGMALTGANNVFNFKVTSTVSGDATIPYEVTARKKDGSTLGEDQIKLYLTATGSETGTNHTVDTDGSVKLYSELTQTTVTVPDGTVEKTIFNGTVPAKTTDYAENFTLRMWVNGEETDDESASTYSPYEFVAVSAVTGTDALNADELIAAGTLITSTEYYALDDTARAAYERIAYVNTTDRTIYTVSQAEADGFAAGDGFVASEQFYQLNGQTFTVTINVYANATVVSGS